MNYSNIKLADVGNGPGVRTTVFVSGCNHRCPGCFNQVALDFNSGKLFTKETIDTILNECDKSYIAGLSILGGEPMDPKNQEEVRNLIEAFRNKFGDKKTIWMWSGYVWPKDFSERFGNGARALTEHTDFILNNINVLVDGPFVLGRVDVKLKFRGSSNQRIINMVETLNAGSIAIINDEDL